MSCIYHLDVFELQILKKPLQHDYMICFVDYIFYTIYLNRDLHD